MIGNERKKWGVTDSVQHELAWSFNGSWTVDDYNAALEG